MKQQARHLPEDTTARGSKNANRQLIGERQGKSLYLSDKPDIVLQEFWTNGRGDSKKVKTKDVGVLRNEISSYLFEYLNGFHIPTHFINKVSDSAMAVKRTEPIPLSIHVYNAADGFLLERLGVKKEAAFEFPVIEHFYVNGASTPAWVNEYHLYALGIVSPEEWKQINRISSKVNAVLRGLCDRRQLVLRNLRLEFGRHNTQVLLTEELSPHNLHFLDLEADDPDRRDRFSPAGDRTAVALTELNDRLQLKV